jgi:hypothetical protein
MLTSRKPPEPRLKQRLIAIACTSLLASTLAFATDEKSASENAIKAAIIFKIAKFVTWPNDSFAGPRAPINVCLPATDPIGVAMDALTGMTVRGRPIEISRLSETDPVLGDCKILYLSKTANGKRISMVSDVARLPVLTIGDTDDFVDLGGIVTLEIQQSRVAFAINVGASERAGLDISAQLLQLATIKSDTRRN